MEDLAQHRGHQKGQHARQAGDQSSREDDRRRVELRAQGTVAPGQPMVTMPSQPHGLVRESLYDLPDRRSHYKGKNILAAARGRRILVSANIAMMAVDV